MILKDDSVNIWGLQTPMRWVLKYADIIWTAYGYELIVTSARDGMHSAGSLHYYGLAVDLRNSTNWGFKDEDRIKMNDELTQKLAFDPNYQIVNHSSHCHVEYDRAENRGE